MRGVECEVSAMRRDDGRANEGSTRGGAERSFLHAGLEETCRRRCRLQVKINAGAHWVEGSKELGSGRAWARGDGCGIEGTRAGGCRSQAKAGAWRRGVARARIRGGI